MSGSSNRLIKNGRSTANSSTTTAHRVVAGRLPSPLLSPVSTLIARIARRTHERERKKKEPNPAPTTTHDPRRPATSWRLLVAYLEDHRSRSLLDPLRGNKQSRLVSSSIAGLGPEFISYPFSRGIRYERTCSSTIVNELFSPPFTRTVDVVARLN